MLHLRLKNPAPSPVTSVAEATEITNHPLVKTTAVTIEMEYDEESQAFVTFVEELQRMSTFGETESCALDNTAEMIRGYIKSMEANRKKIPLAAATLAELKRAVHVD
jgi:predicted RNase H-like HicB family nuclease